MGLFPAITTQFHNFDFSTVFDAGGIRANIRRQGKKTLTCAGAPFTPPAAPAYKKIRP